MKLASIQVPEPSYNDPLELTFLNRVRTVGEELVREYLATNTFRGTCAVSRDAAKRVFPEYLGNPTRVNRLVDGSASAIADAVRRTLLVRPARAGRNWVVILTGAPASGKTRSSSPHSASETEILHETILTSQPRATELIEQALAADRFPLLRLFYTDDPRINVQRMIKRARGIGRTVPLSYMAKTYLGVPAIVAALEAQFGDALRILVTNNSENVSMAVDHNRIARALYHVNRYNESTALEAMHAELDKIIRSDAGIPTDILDEALRG